MRPFFIALLLLATPALAQEADSLAARVPSGAGAYIEIRGLGERVDQLWESPLADAIRERAGASAAAE